MLEKPLTLSLQSARRIIDAEEQSKNGARVFVGYMRRYAPSFVGAFKREVASIEKILYARCRGIVGPNAYFVDRSGASAQKYTDFPESSKMQRTELLDRSLQEALRDKRLQRNAENSVASLAPLGSMIYL